MVTISETHRLFPLGCHSSGQSVTPNLARVQNRDIPQAEVAPWKRGASKWVGWRTQQR